VGFSRGGVREASKVAEHPRALGTTSGLRSRVDCVRLLLMIEPTLPDLNRVQSEMLIFVVSSTFGASTTLSGDAV
jgi:hypothetical protein